MKQNFKYSICNSKRVKEINALTETQWGCSFLKEEALLENDDGRIFIATRDIDKIDLNKVRVNSIGLYVAEIHKGLIRLSIEGSELIGQNAERNVVALDRSQAIIWMSGEDLPGNVLPNQNAEGFQILKYRDRFLGSGKVTEKGILNFVPKIRRLQTKDLPS